MISTPHGAGVKKEDARAGVRGGVWARASSPPPVRLPRISKATRPLLGRSTRYLMNGRGTARDTYRLGLGSGVRG